MNATIPRPCPQPDAKEMGSLLKARLSANAVIRIDEPMAKRTTLRAGGPADLLVEPATEADLAEALKFRAEHGLPFFVIGRGSNLLVKDGGFRGVLIALCQPEFSRIDVTGEQVRCGAGARLRDVASAARQAALSGLEFLEGIPGSIGGALRMNAGAMGSEIFQVVGQVRLMDLTGHISEVAGTELRPGYRNCALLEGQIALGTTLLCQRGARDQIQQRMTDYSRKRWTSQPAAPSAGCMFKNPPSIPAGKLIDELGLKGTRVGGAMVSMEHGNFIVTEGKATAKDVLQLIALIKQKALAERGIELESEVRVIGE